MLGPVDVDAQGDHAGVLAEVHAVDHQRHQVQPGQVRGQQLGQRGLGGRDEPPRHRRARRGRRGLLGAGPDRLEPDRVAARRQPGQHPLQRHPAQHLGRGEQLVGGHRQLPRAVDRAHPRPLDRHPPPAQGHRPALVSVPSRAPLRVVAALRPARRGDVVLHHRRQHLQPGPDRQGQQPLAQLTGQLAQGHAHRVGHSGLARVDLGVLVGLAHGGPLPRGVLGGSPDAYREAGFRRGTATSSSTSPGTTSTRARTAASLPARHHHPGYSPAVPGRCGPGLIASASGVTTSSGQSPGARQAPAAPQARRRTRDAPSARRARALGEPALASPRRGIEQCRVPVPRRRGSAG